MAHNGAVTMLEARTEFFRRSGFPLDGGYDAKWVKLPVGPLTVAFPNVEARKHSRNLYDREFDDRLLTTNFETLRDELGLTGEHDASAAEVAKFIGWSAFSLTASAGAIAVLAAPLVAIIAMLAR